ncbi:hypothetical protein FI667_g17681, partial [Globisporangium splendens]
MTNSTILVAIACIAVAAVVMVIGAIKYARKRAQPMENNQFTRLQCASPASPSLPDAFPALYGRFLDETNLISVAPVTKPNQSSSACSISQLPAKKLEFLLSEDMPLELQTTKIFADMKIKQKIQARKEKPNVLFQFFTLAVFFVGMFRIASYGTTSAIRGKFINGAIRAGLSTCYPNALPDLSGNAGPEHQVHGPSAALH